MKAATALARTWPMLSALGAGLVLLAVAAGAGGIAGAALAGSGIAALGWGVLALRAGRSIAPTATLGVSAVHLAGSGALVGTGLAEATDVAVAPLVVASAFIGVVAVHSALVVRRGTRAARRSRDGAAPAEASVEPSAAAALDRPVSFVGLIAGALLVAAFATPALAATEAGELAVPHGQHSEHGGHGEHGEHGEHGGH